MPARRKRLTLIISPFLAMLITLRLLVLKTQGTSDFSLGLSVGLLIGLSILLLTVTKSSRDAT